jgi:hypothetical protein
MRARERMSVRVKSGKSTSKSRRQPATHGRPRPSATLPSSGFVQRVSQLRFLIDNAFGDLRSGWHRSSFLQQGSAPEARPRRRVSDRGSVANFRTARGHGKHGYSCSLTDKVGHDQRTFECLRCDYRESQLVWHTQPTATSWPLYRRHVWASLSFRELHGTFTGLRALA